MMWVLSLLETIKTEQRFRALLTVDVFLYKAISRVDSRPKLERYLKRFCRRLVCCEYFLNLTPVASPCPDDCKADRKFQFKLLWFHAA